MQIKQHLLLKNTPILALLILLLSSCLKSESYNLTRIGIALPERVGSWEEALNSYATSEAVSLGQPYFLANAENDSIQALQLIDMLALDEEDNDETPCRALVISPAAGATATTFDTLLSDAIPVVLFNTEIELSNASYINFDNSEAGSNAAQCIADEIGTTPSGSILIFSLQGESQTLRREAFKAHFTGATLLEESLDEPSYTAAYDTLARMDSLGQLELIEAIFACDDDVAQGVTEYLFSEGTGDVKVVVGCGGSQTFLSYIQLNATSLVLATINYSPQQITSAVELATNGFTPGEEILLSTPLIDKSNVQEYINDNTTY